MIKKWFLPSLVCLAILFAIVFTPFSALADRALSIVIGDLPANDVLQPKKENNRVYVALRPLAEALGAKVSWDEASQTVTIDAPEAQSLERQVELLQKAIAPATPQDAVKQFAEAIKTRNGAWQYALLTPEMQLQKKETFTEMGWVTGVSSPWVDSYDIDEGKQKSINEWQFDVSFVYATSTDKSEPEVEQISVVKINDHWYISKLE